MTGEARALLKCLRCVSGTLFCNLSLNLSCAWILNDRCGVNVPGVRMVDAAEGVIGIEWIEGKSVRHLLPGGAEEESDKEDDLESEEVDLLSNFCVSKGWPDEPSNPSETT